jgi:N-acetylglucosaminyldiphosphoundecaprenol N-acetyl-beta-D-mannosaminyltransferase
MIFDNIITQEENVIQLITDSLKNQRCSLITYLNQHCFNVYISNSEYKKLLDNNFTIFMDGLGVYAALKLLGFKNVQKFNATDLYYKIFQRFSLEQTKIFLIGGNFSDKLISKKTVEKRLNICGYHNGYFSNDVTASIVDAIHNTAPEVVIIGMGVPKQEFIAVEIAKLIQNKVILCVGGFLEFYLGTKKRAPVFLRKIGLEWVHRLIKEPERMWKRYIIGIPFFLFRIAKLKFSLLGKTIKDNSTLK